MFSRPQVIQNSRKYLLLRTDISLGAPEILYGSKKNIIYALPMRYIIYIVALFHIFRFYWKDRSGAGRCLNRGLIRSLCFRKNDPNKKSQMLLSLLIID